MGERSRLPPFVSALASRVTTATLWAAGFEPLAAAAPNPSIFIELYLATLLPHRLPYRRAL
jgi:hypothetical protein